MVALEKYHQTTEAFLLAVRESGRDLMLCNRIMYLYDGGAWTAVTSTTQDELDRILKQVADNEQFPYAEKYVQLWRNIRAELPVLPPPKLDARGWIALPNGTLDPTTREMHPHESEHYITRRAAIEYKPVAKCPRWLKMLDRMVDDPERTKAQKNEYKLFLQMWFGLSLTGYRNFGRHFRKMLVLYGPQGTAKSSVAAVARQLLGSGNVASDSVDQLSSRFGLASVVGSVAIISDDAVGMGTKVRAEVFKKLVTGEPLAADRKGKDVVQFEFHGPVMLTTNNLPEVRDSTNALYGRTVVLAFTRQFTKEDAARDFDGEKSAVAYLAKHDEFPGILNWALDGLAMASEMDGLPEIAEATDIAKTWRAENDPVYAFLTEHCEFDEGVYNYPLPVSAAISVYAETQMGTREFPTRRVAGMVGRNVQDIVPGTRRGRRQLWKDQMRCYVGLRISESGLQFVRAAKERGLLPPQYPVNETAM